MVRTAMTSYLIEVCYAHRGNRSFPRKRSTFAHLWLLSLGVDRLKTKLLSLLTAKRLNYEKKHERRFGGCKCGKPSGV